MGWRCSPARFGHRGLQVVRRYIQDGSLFPKNSDQEIGSIWCPQDWTSNRDSRDPVTQMRHPGAGCSLEEGLSAVAWRYRDLGGMRCEGSLGVSNAASSEGLCRNGGQRMEPLWF